MSTKALSTFSKAPSTIGNDQIVTTTSVWASGRPPHAAAFRKAAATVAQINLTSADEGPGAAQLNRLWTHAEGMARLAEEAASSAVELACAAASTASRHGHKKKCGHLYASANATAQSAAGALMATYQTRDTVEMVVTCFRWLHGELLSMETAYTDMADTAASLVQAAKSREHAASARLEAIEATLQEALEVTAARSAAKHDSATARLERAQLEVCLLCFELAETETSSASPRQPARPADSTMAVAADVDDTPSCLESHIDAKSQAHAKLLDGDAVDNLQPCTESAMHEVQRLRRRLALTEASAVHLARRAELAEEEAAAARVEAGAGWAALASRSSMPEAHTHQQRRSTSEPTAALMPAKVAASSAGALISVDSRTEPVDADARLTSRSSALDEAPGDRVFAADTWSQLQTSDDEEASLGSASVPGAGVFRRRGTQIAPKALGAKEVVLSAASRLFGAKQAADEAPRMSSAGLVIEPDAIFSDQPEEPLVVIAVPSGDGGPIRPLVVRRGCDPYTLVREFVDEHGLDESELENLERIVKRQILIRTAEPLFVMGIPVGRDVARLVVYPGDEPLALAEAFAQEHHLSSEQRAKLCGVIADHLARHVGSPLATDPDEAGSEVAATRKPMLNLARFLGRPSNSRRALLDES